MALATDLTYLQLRQRITGNLNRDDLDTNPLDASSVVHQFILGRVAHYSQEYFHPAERTNTSKSTAVGAAWVDLPEGWQTIEYVRLLVSGVWQRIARTTYENILASDVLQTPTQSIPTNYALRINPSTGNMAARFFPVPGAIYTVEFTMALPPGAPTLDADVNFWTTEAQNLIINATCEQICRERLNRPMKADQHMAIRLDEEISLGSKAIRAMGGIRAKAW